MADGMYIRMPQAMIDCLQEQAQTEDRSVSAVVRQAVRASWSPNQTARKNADDE